MCECVGYVRAFPPLLCGKSNLENVTAFSSHRAKGNAARSAAMDVSSSTAESVLTLAAPSHKQGVARVCGMQCADRDRKAERQKGTQTHPDTDTDIDTHITATHDVGEG